MHTFCVLLVSLWRSYVGVACSSPQGLTRSTKNALLYLELRHGVLFLFGRVRLVEKDVYLRRILLDDVDVDETANSVLWNSMVHPLLNMTIYGVIWYQG